MKFINFNTDKEKQSLTRYEMNALIDFEKDLAKEITVAMVDPNFDYGPHQKGNKLLIFHEKVDEPEKFVTYEMNGYEISGDYQQMLIGPMNTYDSYLQAYTAVGHAYGAHTEEELAIRRKIKFYPPITKKEREK